jgi:phosphoinositide-3-kinase regulatory subunit 4
MNPGGTSNFYDSSHFANSMIYNIYTRDMYADGGGYLDQSHPLSPASKQRLLKKSMTLHHHAMHSLPKDTFGYDPALFHPRKLLSRLSSLGIPPLPPDLGALRGSDGTPYSIYALSSSPYSQYPIQDGSTIFSGGNSNTLASNSLGGTSANTAMATAAAIASSGMLPSPSGGASGSFGTSGSISSATGMGGIMSMSSSNYRNWRPRKNILVAELGEHSGAVNRIRAAQDFSFLASASNDGTVKLWSIRSLQHSINQGSRCTYDGQGGVLTDMAVIDNSHSVASASSNGSVHVFRVERVSTSGGNFHATGLKDLRTEENDSVMALDHFNTISESLLVYATRNGFIHGWDLRMRREAWRLNVSPELGYVTCMAHSLDVSWFTVGTSRGFILMWDLRFVVLIRIWRHSSHRTIHRLLPCLGLPNTHSLEGCCVPLVYLAAGDGEVAVFDLSIGACRAIFRTLHLQSPESEACKCPTLLHVPIPHRQKNVLGQFLNMSGVAAAFDEIATIPMSEEPNVRAILSPTLHMRGLGDAVITAGEDKQIRYWDIRNGKQSFTVSGNEEAKSFYDNQTAPHDWWRIGDGGRGRASSGTFSEASNSSGNDTMNSAATPTNAMSNPELAWSKLSPPIINICQDASYLTTQGGLGAGVESAITMERRGLVPPAPAHSDCILDLTLVDLNGPMLVSSGRDGMIKVWK